MHVHEVEARLTKVAGLCTQSPTSPVLALLGHAREIAIGSGVSMKIDHKQIAYLPGAIEAARGHFFLPAA